MTSRFGCGDFGRLVVVQAIEPVAGAVNLMLMSSKVRDGLRLSGRVKLLRWVGTSGT